MGEDEIVNFESLKKTVVFWNIADYPIPVDVRPVFGDMLTALDVMGFAYPHMTVMMYSEQLNYDKKHLCDAEVIRPYLHQSGSYASFLCKVPDITLEMIRRATNTGPGPINFWVIAKPKRELDRVLQCLKSRRHNVLRCPFRPDGGDFLFSVDSLLENSRLLGGGKPRFKDLYPNEDYEYHMYREKYVEIKEDVSKTVDFSERIPTLIGARTAVFWDAVDCPFPRGSTPDKIYHSISTALVERDFSDNLTIWAYLDDDDDDDKKGYALLGGGDKTWASKIYFLPGGDKASRRIRMLNDIFLWMRDSPRTTCGPYEASLVLFADQFKDDAYYAHMLQKLHDMRYDLIFITPTSHIIKPESPEWPRLLIDKGTSCFAEPSPQQLEADAAAAAAAVEEEETPEMLPVMSGDMEEDYSRPCRFGDDETSSESSDDEYLLLHDTLPLEPEDMMNKPESAEWPGSEEVCPEKNNEAEEETTTTTTAKFDGIYRWDPVNMYYKLNILFEEEDEADDAKEETTDKLVDLYRWDPFTMTMNKLKSLGGPGRQIDGGSGWGSSEEPCPKKHKTDAAEEETPERRAMYSLEPNTLLRPKNKLKSPEWPGWQIDGGPGSEEPCPKELKEYGNRELVRSVLSRYDALRRRFCQLREAVSGIDTPASKKAGSTCKSRGVITNTMKRLGIVPGVKIGDIFFSRHEMGLVGLQSTAMAGIDYLVVKGETAIATSIVSSGNYDTDKGNPDVLVYTGQGGGNADKENQTSDQKLESGNLALEKTLVMNSPVRVIRGLKEASQSVKIYVYDGLYEVKESWAEKGKSGHNTFKYKLVRAPGQPPAFATWTAIKKWKAGLPPSREGLILTDLTSGVESIGVSLVNNVDDENGPAYFTYSKTVTYSEPFKLTQPSLGCDCSSSCKQGNLNCACIRKNGGDYPYCGNRVLVSRKPMVYECSPSCRCSVCKNNVTQMGIKLSLEVFKTENRGWGLRSWDPIRAGSFICIYAGEAKEKKSKVEEQTDDYAFDTTRVYTSFKWNYEHGLADEVDSEELSEEPELPLPMVISGKDVGNVARFMNHSCSPNVFWQPVSYESNSQLFLHVAFFAISHIPPMTELTYDYGVTRPSEAQNDYTLYGKKKCFCGSECCRGSFG